MPEALSSEMSELGARLEEKRRAIEAQILWREVLLEGARGIVERGSCGPERES